MTQARSPRLGLTGIALLGLISIYCGGSKPTTPAQPSAPPTPPAPSGTFAIACGSDVLDLGWSGNDTRSCSVTSSNGFDGDVTLACTGLSGASCTFAPASVHSSAGASVSATMTISYADDMPFGVFDATITGTVVGRTTTASAKVTVERTGNSVTRHCPAAADVAAIDAALNLIFEHDPTVGNIVCSAAQSSRDLTYFRATVYKALSLMRHISFSAPLPWTSGSLWDWLTSSIRGLRFRGDITQSSCCGSDRIPNISTILAAAHPEQVIFTRLTDLMSTINLFTHEARHANGNGFPHDPRGCGDPSLEYMGGLGVATYLTVWMANQAPSGFVPAQERTGLVGPFANLCTFNFCNPQSCLALPR